MTTTITPFAPVENARYVEVRSFLRGEDSTPWLRATVTDFDAFVASTPDAGWELTDEVGPVGDGLRVLRFARGSFGGSLEERRPCIIELREVSRYGGLYEQIEALRHYLAERGNTMSMHELDIADVLADILAHDRFERDALAPEGHCRHGRYVGGCGIDWMCGPCEEGSE